MRQAIITRWLGPTNARGSRVKATCDAGSLVVAWDYGMNHADNHARAAQALADKLTWDGDWHGGSMPGPHSGYCFVQCSND